MNPFGIVSPLDTILEQRGFRLFPVLTHSNRVEMLEWSKAYLQTGLISGVRVTRNTQSEEIF